MNRILQFQNAPLTDMVAVGAVTSHSARIWLRSHKHGSIVLDWKSEDSPKIQGRKNAVVSKENQTDNTLTIDITGLEARTLYNFYVLRENNELLGQGRFETAPDSEIDTPERFSFAIMSCNQPFDRQGRVYKEAGQMLRAIRQIMRERETKYALLLGDQMYSDFPEPLSLFDDDYFATVAPQERGNILECTSEEVRRLFQIRYRHFWNQEEWMRMVAETPCYPILDDHDIVDNWGSRVEHQTGKWENLGVGARWAYFDYQGSRMRGQGIPGSFHYGFVYGNTATFVMDLRSERKAGDNGRLYSHEQQQDLELFLANHSGKAAFFLVLSVPIIHLPRFLARLVASLPRSGEDFSDRWSSGSHIKDRDRLFRILHDHQARYPEQRMMLLSGDIHIGCVHCIQWEDGTPRLYQVISSPITHYTSRPLQWASKTIIRLNRKVSTRNRDLHARVRPLQGLEKGMRNPFGKLNFGLIELETLSGREKPFLRVMFYGHEKGEPVLRYDSGKL